MSRPATAALLVLVLGSAALHLVAVVAVALLAAAVCAVFSVRTAAVVLCVLLIAADAGVRIDAAPDASRPAHKVAHHGH